MRIMARSLPVCVLLILAAGAYGEDAGSLVIVGGGLEYTQNEVWGRIIELAGGPGAKIAVFPTASSDPTTSGGRSAEALRRPAPIRSSCRCGSIARRSTTSDWWPIRKSSSR